MKTYRRIKRSLPKLRIKVEWRYYKTHLLPKCTWDKESGEGRPPFDPRRYRERNKRSTAGGKYQFLDTTWHGEGGPNYPGTHDAAQAPPLIQERLAHRHYAKNGGDPWVNC